MTDLRKLGSIGLPSAQVHVSNHCNLACRHCYSSSGPKKRDYLTENEICHFIDLIVAEEYRYVSFSGGEPVMFGGLFDCMDHASKCGLQLGLVTNGMMVTSEIANKLAQYQLTIALSIDGPPDYHNQMRQSPVAFEHAVRGFNYLKDAGVAVYLIHTLTNENITEIDWLVNFAHEAGFAGIQIHPLEEAGRAKTEFAGDAADDRTCSLANVLMNRMMAEHGFVLKSQIDTFDLEIVQNNQQVLGIVEEKDVDHLPLSQLVNPLVLRDDAVVVPLQYGPSKFPVADMRKKDIPAQLATFRDQSFPQLQAALLHTIEETIVEDRMPFFNWHQYAKAALH